MLPFTCVLFSSAPRRRWWRGTLLLGLLGILCLPGCGGGGSRPKTYPVEGKLTLDGQPFGPALVMLQSTDPKGPVVVGEADEQGNLKFHSTRAGDGAPQGTYKLVLPPDPLSRAPKPIPKMYQSPGTSPIDVKIEPKKNTITAALDSKAVDMTTPGAAYMGKANVQTKNPAFERPKIDPKLMPKTN